MSLMACSWDGKEKGNWELGGELGYRFGKGPDLHKGVCRLKVLVKLEDGFALHNAWLAHGV